MAHQPEELWLATLNAVLASLDGLGPAAWRDREENSIEIRTKLAVAKGAVSALLRSPETVAHLQAWPSDRDLNVAIAPHGAVASHQIEVLGGRIWLASGFETPEVAAEETFLDWFERTFTRPFPLPALAPELRLIAPDIWATKGIAPRQIVGLPCALEATGQSAYRIIGFAGHGINSWACFFTDIRPRVGVRLRMAFGGVYGDTARDSECLVREIAEVDALVAELLAPAPDGGLDHVEIADCMGELDVRLRRGTIDREHGMLRPSMEAWAAIRHEARGLLNVSRVNGR